MRSSTFSSKPNSAARHTAGRALPFSSALVVYRLATALLSVIAPAWLALRTWRGKEPSDRRGERTGRDQRPRPAGVLIWCHAASVGESLTLLPLIEAWCGAGSSVMVTTGTVTSAQLMQERLPPGAFHRFVPLDHTPWVRRFLDHWRPDAVVWTESELWPNMLAEIARRDIPAALVNARLSDRAFRGWQRWPGLSRAVLGAFDMVLAQSAEDARRFTALGAGVVQTVGNLKLAARALPADPNAVESLRHAVGNRPSWLAASIHPGEDAIVADIHRQLAQTHPGLLTVVVPRHPAKADTMTTTFAGLSVARRSRGEIIAPTTDIYLADTMGELGAFYRVIDLVFMGKSLAVGGGQNPAEAAQLGCAVVVGPDMSNFREMTAALCAAGAARQVNDARELSGALDALLSDMPGRRAMQARARAFMAAEGEALTRTLAALAPLIDLG